jgi:hypothetical protein
VPDHPAIAREPLRAISLLRHNAERGLPHPMAERGDVGAYAVSKNAGRARQLRHAAAARPGPHRAVHAQRPPRQPGGGAIDFHDRGGGPGSVLRPLDLSARERQALAAFLRALSAPLAPVAEPPAYDYGSVGSMGRRGDEALLLLLLLLAAAALLAGAWATLAPPSAASAAGLPAGRCRCRPATR